MAEPGSRANGHSLGIFGYGVSEDMASVPGLYLRALTPVHLACTLAHVPVRPRGRDARTQ